MGRTSTTLGYDVFTAEPIPQNVIELVPNEFVPLHRDAFNAVSTAA